MVNNNILTVSDQQGITHQNNNNQDEDLISSTVSITSIISRNNKLFQTSNQINPVSQQAQNLVTIPSKIPQKAAISVKSRTIQNKTKIVQLPDSNFVHNRISGDQTLIWDSPVRHVFIIIKPNDPESIKVFRQVISILRGYNIHIIVDPSTALRFKDSDLKNILECYDPANANDFNKMIDIVITVGGDGTLLYASNYFPKACPPILAINCGSMGFLTPFTPEAVALTINSIIKGNGIGLTLRTRLIAKVIRGGNEDNIPHSTKKENDPDQSTVAKTNSEKKNSTKDSKSQTITCMNEITIDRGYASFLCHLECFCNEEYFTTVQGDGLLLSTATGSTAYSMSAGGCPVHPSVSCILFTPICPHALSKPIILPDSCQIRIQVPNIARSTAWVSFDGRFRLELRRGDSVAIATSSYPIPTFNLKSQTDDWFKALVNCLHWNVRIVQKAFTDLEVTKAIHNTPLNKKQSEVTPTLFSEEKKRHKHIKKRHHKKNINKKSSQSSSQYSLYGSPSSNDDFRYSNEYSTSGSDQLKHHKKHKHHTNRHNKYKELDESFNTMNNEKIAVNNLTHQTIPMKNSSSSAIDDMETLEDNIIGEVN